MTLEQRAAALYPHSERMQKAWIAARLQADQCRKAPLSTHAAATVYFPRTLQEADQSRIG